MSQKTLLTIIFFLLFLAMMPLAAYTLLHFGTKCPPNEPCVIPVWFSPFIYAPSGVLFAGLAFVLRDVLQRLGGLYLSLIAVILGTILSYIYVAPELAIAACSAYLLSELSDTIVYSILQRYNWILAVFISASVGLLIDSLIFLHLAFHSLMFLEGQVIGKMWMVVLSLPLIHLLRRKLFVKIIPV